MYMNSEERRQFVTIFVNAAPMNSLIGFPLASASRSATRACLARAPCLTLFCPFRRIKTRSLILRDRSAGATFLLVRGESIARAIGRKADKQTKRVCFAPSRESLISDAGRQTSPRDLGLILSPRHRDRVLLAQSSRSAATTPEH
jgi:hypothetical protein